MALDIIERIKRIDPWLRAFAAYDPVQIRDAVENAPAGPLQDLVVGVKDIIDVFGYATGHGSPIYRSHHPFADAACVTLLKRAGAICAGKTVTTEFAFFRPGPTVNPFASDRTPGGSSSGSAAAVATGMVDIGLASQTAASLTRPASYCGIVGFKPSYGRYAAAGIKSLAPSFDTLGVMTRDVATATRTDAVLRGPIPSSASLPPLAPKRIMLCRTPYWDEAEEATRHALSESARLLGMETDIVEDDLPSFADANLLHLTIMSYEAAQALAWEFTERHTLLSPQIADLIEAGRIVDYTDYRNALVRAEDLRARIAVLVPPGTIILAPAAPGAAPCSVSGTGSPVFSRLWTLLRLPTITMPGFTDSDGMPVGIQVLAPFGEDDALLAHAAWVEARLPSRPLPPTYGDQA
ncbi:MAG: amidase [Acetobacter aceti]|nr:amidase [Acetobacter aceti]